jgi:Big-like domain-containing protein
VALLAAVGVGACAEGVTQVGPEDIVALRVTPDSALLAVGRTLQVRAFPLDETSAVIAGQDVSWTSTDVGVVSVDDDGLATGVSDGTAEIVASVASFEARTVVTVAPPPLIVLSADSLNFATQAGGADPPPDSVMITNGGTFALVGMTVDSTVYSGGAQDWLMAMLGTSAAPTALTLTPSATGLTTAGTFTALVWLSGIDADPVAVTVVLEIMPGAASDVAVNDGDAQSAAVGTNVPIAPSVVVTDVFGNGVPNIQVTFAVTAGGGATTDPVVTTDAGGVARVGSWTLGTISGDNTLTVTPAGLGSVQIAAVGVPGAATKLQINAGDNQSAVAGAAVTVSPSVAVLDDFDNGVAGVSVTFAVTSGGGSIAGATQTTDSLGIASVGSWTLGSVAGVNTLLVTSGAVADSVTVTATGLTGAAVAIQLQAGDVQTDTVAATLGTAYAVKVVDVNGNGVAGVPVSWGVTGGGGAIGSTSNTDANGIATSVRVLGTTVGPHLAEGGVGGLTGSPIVFTATATAGAPAVVNELAGAGQAATVGTDLPIDPLVSVEDQFGNPIAGHSVTFLVTGGAGSVAPSAAVLTDASGEASVSAWTLGTVSGANNNALQALAAGTGLAGNPVSWTASADADVPVSISVVPATDGQEAVTGNNVANPPMVTVIDQFGNGVPGVTIDFSPSGSGSVGSPSTATNAGGQAATTWAVDVGGVTLQDDGTFPNSLSATVQGTALATSFTGDAIYSYATHVNPIWAATNCTGCHGGAFPSSGLSLDGSATANRTEMVNVIPSCGPFSPAVRIVSGAGGVAAATTNSVMMMYATGVLPAGNCGSVSMTVSVTNQAVLQAWIQNGAPNN